MDKERFRILWANLFWDMPIPPEDEILSCIEVELLLSNDRMVDIVKRRLMNESFRSIGRYYSITGGRVGQIHYKALRLLRHPSRSIKIRSCVKEAWLKGNGYKVPSEEIEEIRIKNDEVVAAELLMKSVMPDLGPLLNVPFKIAGMSIDKLECSVRLSNCLLRMDLDRIGQLHGMPEHDLLKIKNFGKKSLYELKEILSE